MLCVNLLDNDVMQTSLSPKHAISVLYIHMLSACIIRYVTCLYIDISLTGADEKLFLGIQIRKVLTEEVPTDEVPEAELIKYLQEWNFQKEYLHRS